MTLLVYHIAFYEALLPVASVSLVQRHLEVQPTTLLKIVADSEFVNLSVRHRVAEETER